MSMWARSVGGCVRVTFVHTYQVEKKSFRQDLDNRILANRTTFWKTARRLALVVVDACHVVVRLGSVRVVGSEGFQRDG